MDYCYFCVHTTTNHKTEPYQLATINHRWEELGPLTTTYMCLNENSVCVCVCVCVCVWVWVCSVMCVCVVCSVCGVMCSVMCVGRFGGGRGKGMSNCVTCYIGRYLCGFTVAIKNQYPENTHPTQSPLLGLCLVVYSYRGRREGGGGGVKLYTPTNGHYGQWSEDYDMPLVEDSSPSTCDPRHVEGIFILGERLKQNVLVCINKTITSSANYLCQQLPNHSMSCWLCMYLLTSQQCWPRHFHLLQHLDQEPLTANIITVCKICDEVCI